MVFGLDRDFGFGGLAQQTAVEVDFVLTNIFQNLSGSIVAVDPALYQGVLFHFGELLPHFVCIFARKGVQLFLHLSNE